MSQGLLREGFSRAWHYQRVLWFMFFVSLVVGHFSSGAVTHKLEGVTDHSLQSLRLSEKFDYGTFSALSSNPEVNLFEVMGVSVSFSLFFFVMVLFLTGGILEAYRSGRKLTTREFFEACGSYFWRWVRLLILLLIVVTPLLLLTKLVVQKPGQMMLSAAREKTGFWLIVFSLALTGLLLMFVRLWFDMAQVTTVVDEETA